MNRHIIPVKPYIEIEIDCAQNLLASVLDYYGYDINLCGARWPWEFEYENIDKHWKHLAIKPTKNFSKEYIREYFDIELVHHYYENSQDLFKELNELIYQNKLVLVAVDQYYVPYHYDHIYKKKHGINTVLITGYDLNKKIYACISAFPNYVGQINIDILRECIENASTYWLAYFDEPEKGNKDKQFYVRNAFFDYLELLCNEYKNNISSKYFYSKDLLKILGELTEKKDWKMLSKIVEGDWCWKINRKVLLFKNFIHKYFECYYREELLLEIDEKIDYINKRWVIFCRKLYMTSQAQDGAKKILNCLKDLSNIALNEYELMMSILIIKERTKND